MADIDDQQEFLDDFVKWQAEKKISGTDLSPHAFLIDRAKEQALSCLIDISTILDKVNQYELTVEEFVNQVAEILEDAK